MTKYVFVTGGVVSGLGKGITASSIALLLKSRGYKVFMQKFDPYFNVDPGTMNPIQHGEVYVTYDGCETDLDLGHYERFIDEELNYSSNITSGKIYQTIIEKERKGEFLGATVQMIPHVTNLIKNKVYEAGISSKADIVITEIGGTVGDIESQPFIEALRQIQYEQGSNNTFFVHTTLVPYIYGSDELKTKPTQNSVKDLRNMGIRPDALVIRVPYSSGERVKEKLSLFCSVPKNNIIDSIDVKNIYEIPINYYNQKIDEIILKQFNLEVKKANLKDWEALIDKVNVNINWIDSETLEKPNVNLKEIFKNSKGILVPGGFGSRGIEGKIKAIKYAREENIPYLGLCLGMQLAVIEFARDVCHIEDANSTEFNELCSNPIIDLMADQKAIINMGGTLRLGNYKCDILKPSLAYNLYKEPSIVERHRHRYEFNNNYREIIEGKGMIVSGINPEANLVEIVEIPSHKFFIACQFHLEFKIRPTRPHPLFLGFIKACL